jgi:hypothetical protein
VGATVGPAVGTEMVGRAGAEDRGAPVKRNTVPSTMLNATIAFKPNDAYQRQSRFCFLGSDRLGILLVLRKLRSDYTTIAPDDKSSAGCLAFPKINLTSSMIGI